MDSTLLPWWSVLLVVLWLIALILWIRPGTHPEIRRWSGVAAFVYAVLLLATLASSAAARPSVTTTQSGFANYLRIAVAAVCVLASIWMIGPLTLRGKRLCFCCLTIFNSMLCLSLGHIEVAAILLAVAGWSFYKLTPDILRCSFREVLTTFLHFDTTDANATDRGESILAGILGCFVSLVLLGSVSFAQRVESQRNSYSATASAFPARADIDRILKSSNGTERSGNLVDQLFQSRNDLILLLSTIVFLRLAMSVDRT
jgi:hypothetical protein